MTLLPGYDCSTPIPVPEGMQVTAGYIGGATPRVWTTGEWATMSAPLKLPIYVPTWFRTQVWNAYEDFRECLLSLYSLGVPQNSVVAVDMETEINTGYVSSLNSLLSNSGYSMLLYGSRSYVFQNPRPTAGYWSANRDGLPELDSGAIATQYTRLPDRDLNVFSPFLRFWGTESSPTTNLVEVIVNQLPQLSQGMTGVDVRTLQGLCNARSETVTIDGSFGPLTEAAVRNFQRAYELTVDGKVGPQTWTALILA
jgi:hypothetical protein